MAENAKLQKILSLVAIVLVLQFYIYWKHLAEFSDKKMSLEAEVYSLIRKKDNLLLKISELTQIEHRKILSIENLDTRRGLRPLANGKSLPLLFFVTPTGSRPSQKADLIRLSQTLTNVPNVFWIVVEDSHEPSHFISEMLKRSTLKFVHLNSLTPTEFKPSHSDPSWKFPKGINQRNLAIEWIRNNFLTLSKGVVYFGDDDNAYDLRLFDEMRTITKVGVWPVGLVGGLLAETPILRNTSVSSFNSIWKPDRPFPIDMSGFAINITLLLKFKNAKFTYEVPRGYQESYFLRSLNITYADLEPKCALCSKVYVWHARTAKTQLSKQQMDKYLSHKGLSVTENDAIQ